MGSHRGFLLIVGAMLVLVSAIASIIHSTILLHDKLESKHREKWDNTDSSTLSAQNELSLLRSTSSDYTWVGNNFIPPPGVPLFSPKQMLSYFQKRNVLFIGDSTGRRAYATMYGIMNASDLSDIDVESIDSPAVIDINKPTPGGTSRKEKCRMRDRNIYQSQFLEDVCRNLPALPGANDTGKFDYLRVNCYSHSSDYFTNSGHHRGKKPGPEDLISDYDLIIIASGVYEGMKNEMCRKINGTVNDNQSERLRITLQSFQAVSSQETQFVYRTTGFDGSHRGDEVSYSMIKEARYFFAENDTTSNGNMTLVDWGTVMEKRSWGSKRIEGDISAHYGLEARLLFAQQLIHELTRDELLRSSRKES